MNYLNYLTPCLEKFQQSHLLISHNYKIFQAIHNYSCNDINTNDEFIPKMFALFAYFTDGFKKELYSSNMYVCHFFSCMANMTLLSYFLSWHTKTNITSQPKPIVEYQETTSRMVTSSKATPYYLSAWNCPLSIS